MNLKPNVASCLFICTQTRRFLLVKRSPSGDEGGTWCGVGGGVEEGETSIQALKREVAEEVQFKEAFRPILIEQGNFRGLVIDQYIAFVLTEFEPILNHEHTDFMWTDKLPGLLHPGFARFWHNTLIPYAKNETL